MIARQLVEIPPSYIVYAKGIGDTIEYLEDMAETINDD